MTALEIVDEIERQLAHEYNPPVNALIDQLRRRLVEDQALLNKSLNQTDEAIAIAKNALDQPIV